jgi:hypothetical protein
MIGKNQYKIINNILIRLVRIILIIGNTYNVYFQGATSCRPLSYGACGIGEQCIPAEARISKFNGGRI